MDKDMINKASIEYGMDLNVEPRLKMVSPILIETNVSLTL